MVTRDFLVFINEHQLIKPGQTTLLAVSGGLDSVVMADLFHRSALPFAVAHVNFSLRGAESDEDAVFVQNIARQYGVPFHLKPVDTQTFARQQGISIQMAARALRYDWFSELLDEYGYAAVATAHHLNDVLETVLLNLTRGTGLAGLHGIARRQNRIIRPLLFATRDQLAQYAQEHRLAYREDSSNADDKYARNRIRHHVTPVLTDLNPGLWQTLPRTVERLRAAETLVRLELDRAWRDVAEADGEQTWLSVEKLLALPEPGFCLGEWLKPFGFVTEQLRQVLASLTQPVGLTVQSTTPRISRERAGLLLEPLRPEPTGPIVLTDWPTEPVLLPDGTILTFTRQDKPTDFRPPTDPNIACLDADQLTFPLTIRRWQTGDRFHPLGMTGTKLVSDLLNDLKLTRSERDQTLVLLSGERIAWVIGRRIDHRFRVTGGTGRILKSERANERNRAAPRWPPVRSEK